MIIQMTNSGENVGPMEKRTEGTPPSDDQKLESLQKLQKCCSYYGADYINDNYRSVLMLLAHGLQDNSPVARKLSIEITSEVLPYLETSEETEKIITKEVVPRLVANLCFSNTAIKKSTVHTLHVYMKHFNRVQDVLRVIISQLDSGDAKTRTELMVALPIIITPAFAEEDIYELISALAHRLEVSSIKLEHNAPSMICLEKIKSVLGENVFMTYINRLPDRLQKEYNLGLQKSILAGQDASVIEKQTSLHSLIARTLSNSSMKSNGTSVNGLETNQQGSLKKNNPLAKSTSSLDKGPKPVNSAERVGLIRARSTERVSKNKGHSDRSRRAGSVESVSNDNSAHSTSQTLYYGFIPAETMAELEDNNWKTRAHGIDDLKLLVESIKDNSVLLNNLGDFLEMLTKYVEDPNFKIMLTSLYILRDVVEKIGENMRPHMELLLAVVQTKLGDSKAVIKQLNMQLALCMMHFAKPWPVLKALMPSMNHRNSKVREDFMNMIIAALLTFPSSDFNLTTLPGSIAPMLIDPKRKVRQAVLECFAVIAQGLGPGRMQPLVSSVDMIELNPEGDGVMEAVQARLARRKLPKLTPEGTVEYSMIVTTGVKHNSLTVPPDVSWILYGPAGDLGKSPGEGIAKRYRSAGKKRLPWESDDEVSGGPVRKSLGSAPINSHEDRDVEQMPFTTRNSWAPGQNTSYLEKYHIKGKLGTMPLKQQENLEFMKSDTVGSYFHMYKQRMRKLKQAGLQADNTMINTLNRTTPLSPSDTQKPLVPKSGLRRDSMRTPVSGSRSPVPPHEDKPLSASWSGSEYNDSRLWHKKPTDLEPIGAPHPESDPVRDIESPVHLKPAIARSASKKRRQQHAESDKVNQLRLEDAEENDKKKKPGVDPLVNIRQQAMTLKLQKQNGESQELGSPFDSRPKIARSPSARKSKQKLAIGENGKLSSDTSESGKETPSPRGKSHPLKKSTGEVKQSPEKAVKPPERQKQEGWNGHTESIVQDSIEYEEDFEIVDSTVFQDGSSEESSSSDEQNMGNISKEEDNDEDTKKGHSSLSKSALERVKMRRNEEIRKRELSHIRQREKEAEERARAEKEAREAEERKQAELKKAIAEMKRIEELLKAEERRKQEEFQEKKRLQEVEEKRKEEERRKEEELKVKRKLQAKHDEDEMRRAEELSKQREMSRREQRMRELEALIKVEEQKQDEIRRKNEETRKQELELERKREEEIRIQKELEAQIEEERRKKAEAEMKEARRKKAELKRIKEQQLIQEVEAKMKEEEEHKQRLSDSVDNNGVDNYRTKYEAFEVNFGECERRNSVADYQGGDDANNNFVKPAASRSPKLKRKQSDGRDGRAVSGSYLANPVETEAVAVRRSCTEGHMAIEHLSPFDNPEQAIRDGFRQIGASSEDWEIKCEGLQTFRRLAMYHPDVICQQMHAICLGVVAEVKNLRSQVSRSAIQCLGEFATYLPKPIEPELDLTVSALLSKSGESNAFIKEDVEKSLSAVINSVNCVKGMGAFINGGAGHRNAAVRKMCARFVAQIADKMGAARLLNGSKDVTDRILPVAAQFAVDGNQETRYHGRCILYLMINHPDLDRLIEKHLPKANVRPAKDIVENLKAKGLRDAPTEHGSANIRRSQRNAGSGIASHSVARSSTFSGNRSQVDGRQGSGNKASIRASTNKAARQLSNAEGYQPARPLDLESIAGLNANEWKTRLEAIENFYDLTRTNPEGVSNHISKVFDKFIPRLTDSNSKVNLQALQVFNKVIPILKDALAPLITMLMQSLTSCVASKNNAIYNAGMEVLISLTKFVDNVLLLQPLITAVRYGNTRVKPEMAMRLADLVTPVFQRKPNLVQTHILPVLWHLLSTSKVGSAANSRNDINTATAKLCEELYICYGESLYDEAEAKGKGVKEKLKHYMM